MNKKTTLFEGLQSIRNAKYRFRIVLALITAAVIAIAVIDIAVFQGLFSQIREESLNENMAGIRSVSITYENQLTKYRSQAQLLYRNANIKAYLTSNAREDSHINSIYESLKAVAGNTAGITSIILFNKEDVLASYDTGMVTMQTKEEIVKEIVATSTDKESLFLFTDIKKYKKHVAVFCTDRESLYGESEYGVVMIISLDELQNQTIPWDRDAESFTYIFHKSGELVTAPNGMDESTLSELSGKVLSEEVIENSWQTVIKDEKKEVSYVWAEDREFFVVKIQRSLLNQVQINRALQIIIISTIFGIFAVAVVVWILSGRIYRPLGHMFSQILELAQNENNATNETDELIIASAALADVNRNLALLKSQNRNNMVIRFLKHGIKVDGHVPSLFVIDGMEAQYFEIHLLRYWLEDWTKNNDLMTFVKEWPVAMDIQAQKECFRISQGELCILYYGETVQEKLNEGLNIVASEMMNEIRQCYQIKGTIGIAQTKSYDELPNTYKKAELITEYYILSKTHIVIDERLLIMKKRGAIEDKYANGIIDIIKGNQESDLVQATQRLLEYLAEYELTEAQKCLKKLVAEVIRLAESVAGEKNENYDMYLEDFLTNQIFIGMVPIESWLCDLFIQVKEQLNAGRSSSSSRVMNSVMEYMQNNYAQYDLSLEFVADKFGISTSYLSKLFNNYEGSSFPNYINKIRMEHARVLLISEAMLSVQDVAKQVGFNSSSYFSSAFRKYYGVSPTQIRKSNS